MILQFKFILYFLSRVKKKNFDNLGLGKRRGMGNFMTGL
jgi:hypothetical protein